MKVLVAVVLFAAVAMAEPPRYRQQFQQQRQYYFAQQQQEEPAQNDAPYPPSGWKPSGRAFELPQRQVQQSPQQQYGAPSASPQQQYGAPAAAPQQQYGAPAAASQQQYGAPAAVPQQQYGAPSSPPTEDGNTTEAPNDVDDATTVAGIAESESEPVNTVNELDDEDLDEQLPQQSGEYYVALPDGRLQRVRYVSKQDVEAMKYFAKIRAENVEPLRGPIYAYAPLQKLQILPAGLRVSVAPVEPVGVSPVPLAPSSPAKPEKLNSQATPAKLEIQPIATQVQYQYDSPSAVLPLPGGSYAAYTANYQLPESRYLLSVQ